MDKIFNALIMKERRQLLRHQSPFSEKRLWEHIRKSQIDGIKFRRQTSIGNFVVDFYAPSLKLIIEVDGDSHFTDEAREYDEARTTAIESLGLTVLRFTNDEVVQDIENVLERIRRFAVAQATHTKPPLTPPSKGGEF
ncbi:MAG: endonuclease domain-containing protein [Patescibacteria group bacterium]